MIQHIYSIKIFMIFGQKYSNLLWWKYCYKYR